MNIGLLVAALITLFTWAIHTFLGGKTVARPLLESEMEPVAKFTNYYCWHAITLLLMMMSGGFAYAAWVPEGRDVAALFTILSLAYAVWSGVLILYSGRTAMELPQWTLFVAITAAAGWGLMAG